ncbi:hypothetical protein QU24_19665 [Pantoea rodasii]|uniref:N-acetyltransferase domain-containing protein n=1 Tax=Pantoea rodasii TaxID=1076549 RepID=A0A0B1R167_9GAMM|nr:GNAT family N-acetyltransferase [Pantoea rodasii]KHJ66374.1 hypothetical protein QU24_19665 [Pantoea rodasii]
MLRVADINDLPFIYDFIINEAKNGHFSSRRPRCISNYLFKRGLARAILDRTYRDKDGSVLPAAVFIYETEGQPAGFFALIRRNYSTNEIWLLGVVSRFRGQGLGKLLFATAEKTAREIFQPQRGILVRSYMKSDRMITILAQNGYTKFRSNDTESGVWMK